MSGPVVVSGGVSQQEALDRCTKAVLPSQYVCAGKVNSPLTSTQYTVGGALAEVGKQIRAAPLYGGDAVTPALAGKLEAIASVLATDGVDAAQAALDTPYSQLEKFSGNGLYSDAFQVMTLVKETLQVPGVTVHTPLA